MKGRYEPGHRVRKWELQAKKRVKSFFEGRKNAEDVKMGALGGYLYKLIRVQT